MSQVHVRCFIKTGVTRRLAAAHIDGTDSVSGVAASSQCIAGSEAIAVRFDNERLLRKLFERALTLSVEPIRFSFRVRP